MEDIDNEASDDVWVQSDDDAREAATRRVIERLVELAAELDDEERSALAHLLNPAVELALEDDVVGFDAGGSPLSGGVAAAIRATGLRITSGSS